MAEEKDSKKSDDAAEKKADDAKVEKAEDDIAEAVAAADAALSEPPQKLADGDVGPVKKLDAAKDAQSAEAKEAAKDAKEPSSPWPSARKSTVPPPDQIALKIVQREPNAPPREWPKMAWGERLAKIDARWTRLEARLVWYVLAAEIFSLCFTVLISGLATDPSGGAVSGIVLRSVLGALVLGYAAHRFMRNKERHEMVVTVAVIIGLVLGPQWSHAGVAYFGNVRNWMQNASSLMLVGGVSSLAKRLTLWLALLGASVATAQGKHINVDVVMRFLTPRMRVPVAVITLLGSALVCFGGTIAFFDELAISDYRVKDEGPCAADPAKTCDTSEAERFDGMTKVIGRDFFLLRRQMSLDLKAIPKVFSGTRYDDWMTAQEWNAWMREGSWETYYSKADIDSLNMPEDADARRSPAVIVPGAAEDPQALMIRELDLIVPSGLFIIAIRFLLRALLMLSGWVKADPNAAHAEDLGPHEIERQKREKEAQEAKDAKAAGGAS